MKQAVKILSSMEAIIPVFYFSGPLIYHYKSLPVMKRLPPKELLCLFSFSHGKQILRGKHETAKQWLVKWH